MATQGNKLDNRNNHPFSGIVNGTHFALAHNGVLHNDVRLTQADIVAEYSSQDG